MALYRKYRPATFAEVVGQRHVTEPLSAALESRDAQGRPNRINHAYLFSGPRGCGKTSSARIMARSLNCVEGPTATPCGVCDSCRALAPGGPGNLDVIELDAASHNGVEDMRELREKAIFQPAESRYRIFIIDEAHMITSQGFNALLKIVEEPPEHLIFIFATTEPERLLPTIRSRTHHYPFRLLTPPDMRGLLERVVAAEGVSVDQDVYPLVIQAGGGSPRDSLSIMDQLIAGSGTGGVDYETSAAILGVTDSAIITDAVEALADADRAAIFSVVGRVIMSGQDPSRFAFDLLERMRDLLVLSAVPNALEQGLVEVPESQIDRVLAQVGRIPSATLTRFTAVLSEGLRHFRGVTSPRLLLEVLCARMLLPATEDSVEALMQRVEALERGLPTPAAGTVGVSESARSRADDSVGAPAVSAAAGGSSESAAGSGDGGLSAREAWRQRNAQRKKAAGQPVSQQPERSEASEPSEASESSQPSEPIQAQPAQPLPASEPQRSESQRGEPQTVGAAQPQTEEKPLTEEEAKAQQLREYRRMMREYAHRDEQLARARQAQQREQLTREREGLGGSVAVTAQDSSQPEPEAEQRPEPKPEGVEEIRHRWEEIVQAVEGPHSLAVRVLAEQAVPLEIDQGTLVIGHSTGALATRLNSPDYAQALAVAVKQVTSFDGPVQCVIGTRPRAPHSATAGRDAGEDDPSSRGQSPIGDGGAATEAASIAQTSHPTEARPVQHEEPAAPQRSAAFVSVAQRRAKIEAAKRAAMRQQAQSGEPQPAPAQQVQQPQHRQPVRRAQPNRPHAEDAIGFNGVPLPPEPMEEFAPPEPTENPENPEPPEPLKQQERPVPPVPPVPAPAAEDEEDTSEYFEAAAHAGSLDHRSLKDVVMEMLEKELGAKPLDDV